MAIDHGLRCLSLLFAAMTMVPLDARGGDHGARSAIPAFANIAHRGASGHAPEATRPAFERAVAMGADYLEFDIQMSRDGHLVAIHDTELDRTTDGSGAVGRYTLAELQALDAGTWFNERHPERADPGFEGARLLTLGEILKAFGPGRRYYIETKAPERYPGVEAALIEALEASEVDAREHVVLQSFSRESLLRLRELAPEVPRVQLLWLGSPGEARAAADSFADIAEHAVGIGVNATEGGESIVDAELVGAAHRAGLLVHVYTVDEPAALQRLLDLGVDGIFTNFPDRLAALRGD